MARRMGPFKRAWLWTIKHTLNPLTLRMARQGFGPFSLVRHTGRKSGNTFETPLILARVPDGFVAELTYGTAVSWYRNVVAAQRPLHGHLARTPVRDRRRRAMHDRGGPRGVRAAGQRGPAVAAAARVPVAARGDGRSLRPVSATTRPHDRTPTRIARVA